MENARSIILFSGIDRSRFRNHWKCFCFDNNQLKRNRTFHTPQNFLLANLAVADIINLTFCAFSVIPMVTVLPDGVVGTVLCKFFVGFNVPITAIVASVFTLTVLAVERYNAVVRPLQVLHAAYEKNCSICDHRNLDGVNCFKRSIICKYRLQM